MKLAKRTFALIMCAAMLISCCVFTNAATASVSMSKTGGHNITSGGEVVWTQYDVYGGNTTHTEEVNILTFNPKDGYIPMVFQKNAGSCNTLSSEYAAATDKYGYEVAGIINGSFFGVANSMLTGMAVSNGRLICTHNDFAGEMVAFDSEGNMNVVSSKLSFSVFVNGTELKDSIRYVNKRFECDGWAAGKFYYYDTSCGTVADSASTGYEILCKKVNNSDLTIGGTLFAEVIEVKKDQGPTKFDTVGEESDNFVLYCESTSGYVPYIKDLKAGDDIAITVSETIAASREILENANSVITNVGWLVKDGVDMTETQSTIGSHNVNTTYARWTAFGTKPDGSYVFLTSDGASTGTAGRSLSLREIAATMIELGCNNVIRMDGGGSSAMYTSNVDGSGNPGYLYVSEDRAVADCILIVKKSSAQDADLTTALKAAVKSAKESVEENPNEALSAYIAEAEALIATGTVLEGDARRLIADLSGKGELRELINAAGTISYKDYSEAVLTKIREAHANALDIYFGDATPAEVADACKALSDSMGNSAFKLLSESKKYTTSASNRTDIYVDDGARLTDGSKSEKNAGTDLYAGFNTANTAGKADVIVDLGSSVESNSYTVYGAGYTDWGISLPTQLTVSVSDDNVNFTEVGKTTEVVNLGTGSEATITLYKMVVETSTANKARYVKFSVSGKPHVWLDEVEVGKGADKSGATVGDVIEVHGFNQFVYDSNCFIYTPDFGTLTASGINHKYTLNVILEATDDPTEWKVVSTKKNVGSATDVTLEANQIMIACHKGNTSASKVSDAVLATAKVGSTLKFYGIDVANKNIGVAAYIDVMGGNGDVNDDGAINQYDYILVKRHYFETRILTDAEYSRADVNSDGKVDQYDYILIARHYFGTYTIA